MLSVPDPPCVGPLEEIALRKHLIDARRQPPPPLRFVDGPSSTRLASQPPIQSEVPGISSGYRAPALQAARNIALQLEDPRDGPAF